MVHVRVSCLRGGSCKLFSRCEFFRLMIIIVSTVNVERLRVTSMYLIYMFDVHLVCMELFDLYLNGCARILINFIWLRIFISVLTHGTLLVIIVILTFSIFMGSPSTIGALPTIQPIYQLPIVFFGKLTTRAQAPLIHQLLLASAPLSLCGLASKPRHVLGSWLMPHCSSSLTNVAPHF